MKHDLDILCKHMLDQAMNMWSLEGRVITTTWAVGKKKAVFAQPFDARGEGLPLPARLAMHTIAARAVDALYVGQIDEAYTQTRNADDPEPCVGELADCADTDPTIKTSLCVEGYHARTRDHRLYASRLDLTDDGEPQWEVTVYKHGEGVLGDMFARVAQYANDLDHKPSMGELVTRLLELHWTCVEIDTDMLMREVHEHGE